MDTNEINYKILRKIQQIEEKSPILTKIDSHFYNSTSEYIKNLNIRLDKESNSQKQMLLKNEIQNTNKIIRYIYENREKKIILASISKARGGKPDLRNLIKSEKYLFDSTLELILHSRKQLLSIKSKDKTLKESEKFEIDNEEKMIKNKNYSNQMVMVIKDIPEFIGTDEKNYNLRKGDLLSLPEKMSEMLLKKKAVKKIRKHQE
jgi:DNA replication factor GINS